MRLYIDAGNTRLKWCLCLSKSVVASGVCDLSEPALQELMVRAAGHLTHVAVSTVMAEARRHDLTELLGRVTHLSPSFYWSEPLRGGLISAYADPTKMGADRWHGMYGAWLRTRGSFILVDAGSAMTVDYVTGDGRHKGGYILPGKQMMLKGLRQDVARVGFDGESERSDSPGGSTNECVHHGIHWMWGGVVDRLNRESALGGYRSVVVTGGDAADLLAAGLKGSLVQDIVLAGLIAVDYEERPE